MHGSRQTWLFVGALVLVAMGVQSCSRESTPVASAGECWLKSFKAADADAVAGCYVPDAVLWLPGGSLSRGRDAIRKDYAGFFGDYTIKDAGLSEMGHVATRDTRTSWGTYRIVMVSKKGGEMIVDRGRYTDVSRKVDGRWMYAVDHASADPALDKPVSASPHRVEMTARGMQFEAPGTVASGWTTFRFHNASALTHFAVIERLPPDVGMKEYEVVGRLFQDAMNLINKGKPEEGMKVLERLPAWVHELTTIGGPGLTAPGRISQATVFLEPGRYMIECYVKTEGVYHSYSGPSHPAMVHLLTVTASDAPSAPPNAHVSVVVDEGRGMSLQGAPMAGEQTFAVHFRKQDHNVMGPDVHLFRVRDAGDVDRANAWVNAMSPAGMETPAPLVFLGGTQEAPTGSTTYFTARLQPGRYALISEVDDPVKQGLLATFTVPPSAIAEVGE